MVTIRLKHFTYLFFLSMSTCIQLKCAESSSYWKIPQYIWDFGMIFSSDKGFDKTPEIYFASEPQFDKSAYQNIQSGDIVWLKGRFLKRFSQEILPDLKYPIVLLITDGDETFPTECGKDLDIESLLNNNLIIHVFAQNNAYKGPSKKVSHIPIGVDFHTIGYNHGSGAWGEVGSPKQQAAQLNGILRTLKPTCLRKKRAFVDFHWSDTMHGDFRRYLQFGEDRCSIFQRLLPTGLIDHDARMRRSKLWECKGEYAFSISPHGNGLDCHRTWEDLILGCIVIVKTSPLDPLYDGLPVVIIKDWAEITSNNLDKWLAQYKDAFTNPSYREKLTYTYWFSKVLAQAQPYKK